jgi:hypothetical protein
MRRPSPVAAACAAALAFAAAAPVAAQEFEGRITIQTASDPGKPGGEMVLLAKGNRSRIEVQAQGMAMYVIMDLEDGSMTSVMPAQRMFMRMDMKQLEQSMPGMGGEAAAPKLTRTGRTETIAGYSCEHVLFESDKGDRMDICGAKGLGFFGGAPGGPLARSGGARVPAGYEALTREFKDGFFPLRMEVIKGTTRQQVMLVTKIERQALEASLFAPPAGFQEMKMPAMPGAGRP